MDVLEGETSFAEHGTNEVKGDSVSLIWQPQPSLSGEGGPKALPVDSSRRIDTCSPVPAAWLAAVGGVFAARLDSPAIAKSID